MRKQALIKLALLALSLTASVQYVNAQAVITRVYYHNEHGDYDAYTAYYSGIYYPADESAFIVFYPRIYKPFLFIGLHIALGDPYWYYPRVVWPPKRIRYVYYGSPWHHCGHISYFRHYHYYRYRYDYACYPPSRYWPPHYRNRGHHSGYGRAPIAYQPRDWQHGGTKPDTRGDITRRKSVAVNHPHQTDRRKIAQREMSHRPTVQGHQDDRNRRQISVRHKFASSAATKSADRISRDRTSNPVKRQVNTAKSQQDRNYRRDKKRSESAPGTYAHSSSKNRVHSDRSRSGGNTSYRSENRTGGNANTRGKTYRNERQIRSRAVVAQENEKHFAGRTPGKVNTNVRKTSYHQTSKKKSAPHRRIDGSSSEKHLQKKTGNTKGRRGNSRRTDYTSRRNIASGS